MVLKIIISVSMLIVLVVAALEFRGWLRGAKTVLKQQKVYRVTAAIVLETVMAMILFGPKALGVHNLLLAAGFWASTLALSFGLVVIALLDMKATLGSYQTRRSEILQQFIDEEIRKNQR